MSYFDFDGFADLIADRVVAKLAEQNGQSWPQVETPTVLDVETKEDVPFDLSDEPVLVERETETVQDDEGNFSEEPKTVQSYDEVDTHKAERVEALENLGATKVKELLKARGEDLRAYKNDLFVKAADFEIVSGAELDDASEADLVEPEAEDVEPEPLTRDAALELDLAVLKEIAIDNGLEESELVGKDVDAVVDLLFGVEVKESESSDENEVEPADSTDDDDEEEEVELTEAEIRDASLGQLKEWATQFGLDFARSISRNDLIELILSDEE